MQSTPNYGQILPLLIDFQCCQAFILLCRYPNIDWDMHITIYAKNPCFIFGVFLIVAKFEDFLRSLFPLTQNFYSYNFIKLRNNNQSHIAGYCQEEKKAKEK